MRARYKANLGVIAVGRGGNFRLALLAVALATIVAMGGCTITPGGIAWIAREEETYVILTDRGEETVTCEWFSHDTTPYWEPTTEDTYRFQWVCDAIPRYWGEGSPPRTAVNPRAPSEVARRV